MFVQMFPHILFLLTLGGLANSQRNYVATVMELGFTRDTSLSDFGNILRITRDYVAHIQRARANAGAQIVVFPEYGLTTSNLPNNLENISTMVPTPSDGIVPCRVPEEGFATHLKDLSCAALEHTIHVVVNLVERAISSTNSTIFYNTNVLFDDRGAVRARYRKINLINEPMFTPGEEAVAYTANFGVTFGLLTSTDLLYRNPLMTLIEDHQVTDLIFPNFWRSEMPFLSGLSAQDGFSKAFGVNLLASGYSNPSEGIGGAGIFLANATVGIIDLSTTVVQSRNTAQLAIISTRTPESVCEQNLNISPRIGGQAPDVDGFAIRSENMELYTFADLEMGVNETSGQVCSEGSQFCCDYHVTFNSPLTNASTVYKVAAFYGVRGVTNSDATIGVRNCALVACENNDSSSCGLRPSSLNVDFARIMIKTNVPVGATTSYMPSTLDGSLSPLGLYTFCQGDVEDGNVGITMSIERTNGVLTFGIFGRAYYLDGRGIGRGIAGIVRSFAALTLSSVVLTLII